MKSNPYSTKNISTELLKEISQELDGLEYGSLEVYVNAGQVTQITKRQIRKTNNSVK